MSAADNSVLRRHTAASVADIIRENIEPESAEDVLDALRQLQGATITPRLLDHLPGGRVEWRVHRQLGDIELRNRAYIRAKRDGICLTIAQHNENTIDADFVERQNHYYFRDRRERNALRRKALADPALLERVAKLFNEIEEINAKRTLIRQQLDAFMKAGEPFSPDRAALERACGIREIEDNGKNT